MASRVGGSRCRGLFIWLPPSMVNDYKDTKCCFFISETLRDLKDHEVAIDDWVGGSGSNLVSVTDLKRIQTPRSLCCDFGGDRSSGNLFQLPSSWGRSPHCLGRRAAIPGRRQSLRAATGWLEEHATSRAIFGPRQITFFSCEMKFLMELQGLVVGRFSGRPRAGQDHSRCECCIAVVDLNIVSNK